MEKKNVVIVSALRTPFDKFGGPMKGISSIDLAAFVMDKVCERVNLDKSKVDQIYYGSAMHAEIAQYQNIPARQASLKAGFPNTVLSVTIDRACNSSVVATQLAYKDILLGETDIAIACGADNFSNMAYLLSPSIRWGTKMGDVAAVDEAANPGYRDFNSLVARDAGEVAVEYNVSREEQDEWAYLSQMRYQAALKEGKLDDEIIPFEVPSANKKIPPVVVTADQSPRPDISLEALSKLRTVLGSPTITAGNAPGLSTGASALLIMSEEKAKELGMPILGYIRDYASVCDEVKYIPRVPGNAIKKVTKKYGITCDDLKVIEINEAFALMPLLSTTIMADGDEEKAKRYREICNVNGGAVALGHPIGGTGTRIIASALYELRRRGGGYGIAAICGGMAQGDAILIEVTEDIL